MKKLLLKVYDYFSARKWLLFTLVFVLIAGFAFVGSRVRIEEDVTKMLPDDEKVEKLNMVFRNSKLTDKLIVKITQRDTVSEAQPDSLIAYAETIVAAIDTQLKGYVREVRYKVSDDAILTTYNTVHENLPIYLEKEDYVAIDSLTTATKLRSTLENDYKLLTSPSGLVLKKIIADDPTGISNIVLKRLQKLQADENYELYDGFIMTKDRRTIVLFISPSNPPNETANNSKLIDGLDEIFAQANTATPNIKGEYFGGTAVAVGNARQLKKDTQITMGIALTVLVLFIGLFFRRKRVPFIMLLPVVFGSLLSMAVIWLYKGEISSISLAAGSAVLGIAINYSLHFLSHYRHTRNIKETIGELLVPMTIGSVTTVGSFFGLLFVKSEILNDFGLFAGFSLIGAAFFTLIFLPHFVSSNSVANENSSDSFAWFDKIVNYRSKRPWIGILLIVALTIFFAQHIHKVGFESDMLKLNYMNDDLKAAEQSINQLNEGNVKTVYVVTTGNTVDEALQNSLKSNQHADALLADGKISNYSSVSDFIIPQNVQQERIARWNNYWTADKKAALKKILIAEGAAVKFREAAFNNFFTLLDKPYEVQPMSAFADLRKNFADDYIIESEHVKAVITSIKTPLANVPEVKQSFSQSNDWFVLDKQIIAIKFVEVLNSDFNTILTITALLVFFALLLSYGRIEPTLMTFLPMLVTWIWILGIMGLAGIKFNIINIIVSTFVFGLGDDYSIFIMDGLTNEYKYGKKVLASHKESILLSAITTILGFGALIFAKHPALQSIALIAMIGLFCVLVISQTLIPFLYERLILKRKERQQPPYVWYTFLYSIFDFLYYVVGSFILTIIGYILIYLLPIPKKWKKNVLHFMLKWLMWGLVYVSLYVRKRPINTELADFSKPAIIIANHSSFLDILLTVMQHPKVILLTNDWVWNSPVFGKIVQLADYYPVSKGVENSIDQLEQSLKEGYSVVIFPEGTRSTDSYMNRFHKGAFFIAEKLKVDIQPLVLHGIGDTMRKSDFQLMPATMTWKYLPRIKHDDATYGTGYSERTKMISRYFKAEYEKLRVEFETPAYHYNRLITNYIYKGPVLEWYTRIKVKLEDNYNLYHNIIPRNASILNLGCGYGYMEYMLYLCANDRKLTGVDYDEEKIEVANNAWLKNENVNFEAADVTKYEFGNYDVFVLNDLLHYIPYAEQEKLLEKCFAKLNDGGMILVKDANTKNEKKQRATWLTEFFSTNFGFNKTAHSDLFFPDEKFITEIATRNGMSIEVLDESKVTSNTIYLIKKK